VRKSKSPATVNTAVRSSIISLSLYGGKFHDSFNVHQCGASAVAVSVDTMQQAVRAAAAKVCKSLLAKIR